MRVDLTLLMPNWEIALNSGGFLIQVSDHTPVWVGLAHQHGLTRGTLFWLYSTCKKNRKSSKEIVHRQLDILLLGNWVTFWTIGLSMYCIKSVRNTLPYCFTDIIHSVLTKRSSFKMMSHKPPQTVRKCLESSLQSMLPWEQLAHLPREVCPFWILPHSIFTSKLVT